MRQLSTAFLSALLLLILTTEETGAQTIGSLRNDLESGERSRVISATTRVQEQKLAELYPAVHAAFSATDDETIRRQALFLMSRAGAPQVPVMVVEAIDDPKATNLGNRHLSARELALQRVLRTEDESVIVPAIRRAIADSEVYYRKHGAAALAAYPEGHELFAKEIEKLATDPNPVVRFTFFSKLKVTPTVKPFLFDAIYRSNDPGDIISAAFAISRDPDWPEGYGKDASGLTEFITGALGNPDEAMAGAAAGALSFLIRKNQLTEEWFDLDPPENHRRTVMVAHLFRELNAPFDLSILRPVIERGEEPEQLRAVAILSEVGTVEAVPMLELALRSDSADVRKSAVFGLRAVGWIADFTEVGTKPNGRPVSTLVGKTDLNEAEHSRVAAASAALKEAQVSSDAVVARLATDALARIGAIPPSIPLLDLEVWNAKPRPLRKLNYVAGNPLPPGEPLAIGNQKQLFIDDFIIDQLENAKRAFHAFEKHPANPIFHAQMPWEENWVDNFMCSVHYDETSRDFKLWYRCGANHTLGAYAVSEDGIAWYRPNLGRVDFHGSSENNLLGWKPELYRDAHQPGHNVSYLPDADLGQRYLSFFDYSGETRGFYVSSSPEGIRWSQPTHAQVIYGDVASLIPDPVGGFLLFPKQALWIDGYRRSFGFAQLKAVDAYAPRAYPFVTLPEKHDALVGREAARSFGILAKRTLNPADGGYYSNWHTQIYSVTPLIYEGMVLGFYDLWYLTGKKEGPLEMLLKATRDRKQWFEVGYPKAFLPRGKPGEWDAGMVYGGSNILVIDDEIRFYYAGFNLGHYTDIPWGSQPHQIMGVGLATMRLDGFASIRAGDKTGTVTTKPLQFSGSELQINAIANQGQIRAEILDENGTPIPGFTAETSIPVKSDGVREILAWQNANLVDLVGKTVQIRFLLENADLFAFQFRDGLISLN